MSAARSKRSSDEQAPSGAWVLAWKVLGWGVLLSGVGLGLLYLEQWTRATAPPVECRVELVNVPEWLLRSPDGLQILEEVRLSADLLPNADIFDPSVCAWVAQQVGRSPWVAGVRSVTKQPDGLVRVDAEIRQPFAFVQVGEMAYLVDRRGVRLPREYAVEQLKGDTWMHWFRLIDVDGPVPEVGAGWAGQDIRAGLDLAAFLNEANVRGEVSFRPALVAIDVGNVGEIGHRYGQLQLRTVHERGLIAWGEPIGQEAGIEPSPGRKLELLRTYYSLNGGQFPDGTACDPRWEEGVRISRLSGRE